MVRRLSEEKAREMKRAGLNNGQLDFVKDAMACCPGRIDPDPPFDRDKLMHQPVEAWDKTDRKGRWGGKKFFHGGSREYVENLAKIDWSDRND